MGKQWYDFFVHGQNGKSKKLSIAVLLVLLLALWSIPPGFADGSIANSPEVQLPSFDIERENISKESISPARVGDLFKLRIYGIHLPGIDHPSQQLNLDADAVAENLHELGWEVTQSHPEKDIPGEYFFQVAPLKPGKLTLPPLVLKDVNGNAVAKTHPFTVEVESAINPNDPKPQQAEDLEPPVSLQFPGWILALIVVFVFLVLGSIIFGFYSWRKRNKKPSIAKPVIDTRTEDEIALAHLLEVEKSDFLAKGNFKAYYFRVSEILKAYIGSRCRFDALECTTREMVSVLESKKIISDEGIKKLEAIFEKLDRVKFTDHLPVSTEPSLLISESRDFIHTTRRVVVTASQVGATSHAT